jgi:hypothetical protein
MFLEPDGIYGIYGNYGIMTNSIARFYRLHGKADSKMFSVYLSARHEVSR